MSTAVINISLVFSLFTATEEHYLYRATSTVCICDNTNSQFVFSNVKNSVQLSFLFCNYLFKMYLKGNLKMAFCFSANILKLNYRFEMEMYLFSIYSV